MPTVAPQTTAPAFASTKSPAFILLAVFAIIPTLLFAAPAAAQYVWLDANGDGVTSDADVLAPSGTTTLDVWMRTDQNRDGTPAVCASGDGILNLAGYQIVLGATNGTVTWGSLTNQRSEFPTPSGPVSSGSELAAGYFGSSLPPGAYRLATVQVSVATGTPAIGFSAISVLDPSFTTSFGSVCSGTDLDGVIKLGVDFTDAQGVAYGGAANHPPVLAPIGDVTMAEGEGLDVTLSATDSDGDPISLSLVSGPPWASVLATSGSGTVTGTLHLSPGYSDAGDASVTVAADDPFTRDQKSLTVHVANTNRPPVILQPDSMMVGEGGLLNESLRADDPDGEAATFFLVSGPAFVTVSTVSSGFGTTFGNVRVTPGYADAGMVTVSIGARDNAGAADSVTYTLMVREIDRPPTLTLPGPLSGMEGEPVTFVASGTDPDGDMVMFFADALPAGAQLVDAMNGTATFLWVPGFDQAGTYTITITADDMVGQTRTGSVDITVADVTDPVAVARPKEMVLIEGDVQDQGLLGYDASGDPLTFEKVSGPSYVTVTTTTPGTGTAQGEVHVAPGAADAGTATVVIAATDGANRDTTSFTVTVIDAGDAPGEAPFAPPFLHVGAGLTPHTVTAADINKDGIPDLVLANLGSNTLSILPGRGGLEFDMRTNLTTSTRPHTVIPRDLNGDGNLDLAVSQIGANSFAVFLGRGDGTFGPRTDFPLQGSPVFIGIGDFNEDGKPDVVASNQTLGSLEISIGAGDGTFGATTSYPTGANAHGVVIADFNGDGHADVAVAGYTVGGNVSVLLGRGDGTFQTKRDFSTSFPHTLAAGDLDQDGDADLVVSNFDTGRITIALGNGDGTFATLPEIPTGKNAHASAVGDVNGDGRADIVVANQGANTVSMILGKGGASWAPKIDYPVGAGAHSIAIADLDGDHLPEVVSSNIFGNTVTILKNRGVVRHEARFFAGGGGRTLLLRAEGQWTLHVESADGLFRPEDIVPESVQLMSHGTGTVDHIAALPARTSVIQDSDKNGIPEAVFAFGRDDLRALFASVAGRKMIDVTLEGRLVDGTAFEGMATIEVVGIGPPKKPIARAFVFPNPLNPVGTISFELWRPERVTLHIYDVRGRLVKREFESKRFEAGVHRVPVQATDRRPLASGVYFFRITTPDGSASGRFAVLR